MSRMLAIFCGSGPRWNNQSKMIKCRPTCFDCTSLNKLQTWCDFKRLLNIINTTQTEVPNACQVRNCILAFWLGIAEPLHFAPATSLPHLLLRIQTRTVKPPQGHCHCSFSNKTEENATCSGNDRFSSSPGHQITSPSAAILSCSPLTSLNLFNFLHLWRFWSLTPHGNSKNVFIPAGTIVIHFYVPQLLIMSWFILLLLSINVG